MMMTTITLMDEAEVDDKTVILNANGGGGGGDDNKFIFFISWGNLPVKFLFTDRSNTTDSYKQYEWLTDFTHAKDNTLTCSFEVTAQNTISVKFCEGNMRKQIPPIGLLSLTKARVLCFLQNKQCISHRTCTNSSRECNLCDTTSILLDLLLN